MDAQRATASAAPLVHEAFDLVAGNRPDGCAIVWRGTTFTYSMLGRASEDIARRIAHAGVARGTPVAFWADRTPASVAAMLGIVRAGCIYVPLDRSYPDSVVREYLERSGVGAIVEAKRDPHEGPHEGLSGEVELTIPAQAGASWSGFEPAPGERLETPAYIMFTSGSTGKPKGVLIPHRGITRLVLSPNYIRITPEDTLLLMAPLTFDAATFEVWGALLNGARLVIYEHPTFDPNHLEALIRGRQVSVLFLTTAIFHILMYRSPGILSGLRMLLVGGEVTHPEAINIFLEHHPGTELLAVYGPTENTTFSTFAPIRTPLPPGACVPIGRPVSGTTAHVLDEQGRHVPAEEAGELYVGGDGVALGYIGDAAATARSFPPDLDDPSKRMYRTGDLVKADGTGSLEFLGRTDNLVKVRGHRVSTSEVAAAIAELPKVEQAVVRREERGPEEAILVAYVQSRQDPAPLRREIMAALRHQLPNYMVPSLVRVLPNFPINRNGKVDLARLTSMQNEGSRP